MYRIRHRAIQRLLPGPTSWRAAAKASLKDISSLTVATGNPSTEMCESGETGVEPWLVADWLPWLGASLSLAALERAGEKGTGAT